MEKVSIESLDFESVSFSYEDQTIFKEVDFSFPLGEKVRFRLHSGSGSSTLLQVLAGLRQGTGQYKINGQNVFDMSFEEFLPLRLNIGYSFDYGGLLANKTLKENLLLPLQYHKLNEGRESHWWVRELLERLLIFEHADKRPAMVTGGVRKTACVLRALVMKPELLLLDDPTTGLHPLQVTQFVSVLEDLRAGGHLKHLYFVSQDSGFLAQMEHSEVTVTRDVFVREVFKEGVSA